MMKYLDLKLTGGFDADDELFIGINAAYQVSNDAGFYGVASYPQHTVSDSFAVGLRGELFGLHDDSDDDLPLYSYNFNRKLHSRKFNN